MKENLSNALAQIAVRLGVIATDQCLALSVCESEDALKECIRNKSNEIHAAAQKLLDIAKKGGAL